MELVIGIQCQRPCCLGAIELQQHFGLCVRSAGHVQGRLVGDTAGSRRSDERGRGRREAHRKRVRLSRRILQYIVGGERQGMTAVSQIHQVEDGAVPVVAIGVGRQR
ncbi:MAG: hypothetical protein JAZ17_22145 [Candidatus Thiodiazotropha endolucinida]|nr:hypothetical protein [Candidatus Thiodiazotropha taylori]MCG8096287.1 hypothetical protein [Candidatus Thiodiazotropha endolucinida]MCW4264108.1 hypothetical protein [Candidatus Thiodiazotropha endolucinida]